MNNHLDTIVGSIFGCTFILWLCFWIGGAIVMLVKVNWLLAFVWLLVGAIITRIVVFVVERLDI